MSNQIQEKNIYEKSNLTKLQLLYWMARILRPQIPLFNAILAFTFSGNFNRKLFEEAFRTLVEKCDVLRTVVHEVDGVPRQKVVAQVTSVLKYIDFLSESDPEKTLNEWMQKQSNICLDPKTRLFDSVVIRSAPDKHVWYFNQDHMIADASSAFLIFNILAHAYEDASRGKPMKISEPYKFIDYIDYERKYRDSSQHLKDQVYWMRKLSPGPDDFCIYGRDPLPILKSSRVKRHSYDLGLNRSQCLRTISKNREIYTVSEDLSLFNIFASIFFILLYRISGNHRLGFVSPVHNRFNDVFRNTVGLLMEICPFQIEISESDTFISLIKKFKREIRENLLHYQCGSGLSLNKKKFDIMFNLYRIPEIDMEEISVKVERIYPEFASESLALHIIDFGPSKSFLCNFVFRSDDFEKECIDRIIKDYVELLDYFLKDSSKPINKIPMYSMEQSSLFKSEDTLNLPKTHKYKNIGMPQDMLELQLKRIWEEILEATSISIHDNFFDLGGNSWSAVRLFVQIEKLTGQYLPLTTLVNSPTISGLAQILRQNIGSELWKTLVTIQSGDNRRPLFMVPGAGGNGLAVTRIAQHLQDNQPVYMFQIPLFEIEENPQLSTIEGMAKHYIDALLKVQPKGPYLLGGYSAGGLVAFEVAQQLVRQGKEIELLAIIDVPAQSHLFQYVRLFTKRFCHIFGIQADKELQIYLFLRDQLFKLQYFLLIGFRDSARNNIYNLRHIFPRIRRFIKLDRQEKKARIQNKLQKVSLISSVEKQQPFSNTANEFDKGDLAWQSEDRYMRKYFKVNSIAVKCYIPRPYPGRITLFRSVDGYQYQEQRSPFHDLGWGKIAADRMEVFMIPGNHMQIVREPNVKILGEKLSTCIERSKTKNL